MKSDPNRISILLIEEGSSIITLRIIRCLGITNQYRIHLLSFSGMQIPSFRYSRYISSYVSHKRPDDEQSLRLILQTAGIVHADIVMPLMEKQSKIIAKNFHFFEGICLLPPIPDHCTMELVINKYLLSKWLFESDFSNIKPVSVKHLKEQEINWDKLTFPLLIKPFWGSSGEGILKIDEPSALKPILETGFSTTEFLIQPYISGSDIDLSALVENGKIIAHTIQHPAIENTKFKYSKKIEFIQDLPLLKLCERIFEKLNYSGIAHLDFRYDPIHNSYHLVDFNARYWSTITGSLKAGINFPHLACQTALKKNVEPRDYKRIKFLSSESLFYIFLNSFRVKRRSIEFLLNNELYYGICDPLPLAFNFVNLLKAKMQWLLKRRK